MSLFFNLLTTPVQWCGFWVDVVGTSLFFTCFKVVIYWCIKFKKGWGYQEEEGSNNVGGVFFSFFLFYQSKPLSKISVFLLIKEAISFNVAFQVCYKRNPRSYLIATFWSIWRKLRYQFYLARNETLEIMEEVCEVGPENLRNNFWDEELFSAKNVSRYVPV